MDSDDDTDWVHVAKAMDLADETAAHVQIGRLPVCLARSRGRLYATVDRCTHQDVPLSEGEVEDGTIECYQHGSKFDLESGRALGPPAVKDVTVFPVRLHGDDVYVSVPRTCR